MSLLFLLTALLAGADDAPDRGAGADVVTTPTPIDIDGVLDETAWQSAEPVTDFLRFQPIEGGPPPGSTEVRFLQDDRYLYVGVKVDETGYPVRARISRREDINADDQVGVYLDTFQDGRTGYIFYFNGRGIQQDIRVGPGFSSFNWNTVLRTGGKVTDEGFTLEIAIPWRSLKYPRIEGENAQTWGLILTRKIPSEGAKYSYPVTQRAHPRLFTQATPLRGVRPAPRGSGVEIIPSLTVVQQASREDRDDLNSPLRWVDLRTDQEGAAQRWLTVVRPSLDARIGLTPNLGLTATLNPDFSQVDQDPTFIDLNQRFAFFLPERRPFFLDGNEYFADQQNTLYSRSIVDPVYGLKLSGRAGAWSLGALHALDRSPGPSVHERGTEGFTTDDVEDAYALNDLVRARVDAFGDGYVGVTVGDKRLFDPTGQARGSNTTGALDLRAPIDERWTLDLRTQQSLTTAPDGDTRWGQTVGGAISRAGGIGLGTSLSMSDTTLGFRNEMGFVNQSGITRANGSLNYTFEPKGIIDTFTPAIQAGGRLERNGENQQSTSLGASMRINGIHSLYANIGGGRVLEGTGEDAEGSAVGLVEVIGPAAEIGYNAELGKVLAVRTDLSLGRVMDFANLAPADAAVASGTLTLRPTPGLRLDTTLRGDQLHRDNGEVARAALLRHWTAWQFTKELGLRSMVEWSAGNERRDQLVTTVLLTWLENPQTALHVGWIERTSLHRTDAIIPPKTQDRSIFLKATVLFRP